MSSPSTWVARTIVAVALVLPSVLTAQVASAPSAGVAVHADSTLEAAATQGRAAAGRPGMGGRFAGGFVGGFAAGLLGTGVVYAIAAGSNADLPAAELAQLAGASPEYREVYERAYRDRLRSRRKTSALAGGLVGTALIVTVLVAGQSN